MFSWTLPSWVVVAALGYQLFPYCDALCFSVYDGNAKEKQQNNEKDKKKKKNTNKRSYIDPIAIDGTRIFILKDQFEYI
mgnify:CR=1 FL=1